MENILFHFILNHYALLWLLVIYNSHILLASNKHFPTCSTICICLGKKYWAPWAQYFCFWIDCHQHIYLLFMKYSKSSIICCQIFVSGHRMYLDIKVSLALRWLMQQQRKLEPTLNLKELKLREKEWWEYLPLVCMTGGRVCGLNRVNVLGKGRHLMLVRDEIGMWPWLSNKVWVIETAMARLRVCQVGVNAHMHRFGMKDICLCRCGDPETIEHFLMYCVTHIVNRNTLKSKLLSIEANFNF